jgi:hypothetical protein
MRIKELLEGVKKSPSNYSGGAPAMSAQRMTAPAVSTMDRSAPWTKAAIGKSYKRTKDFNELETAKEKFDFLHNLTSGKTANKIRIEGPKGMHGYTSTAYRIQSYKPATGDITLLLKTPQADVVVAGNTNNFKYQGRTKSVGGPKTYTFIPSELTKVSSTPIQTTRGRPTKKQYTFPKMPW